MPSVLKKKLKTDFSYRIVIEYWLYVISNCTGMYYNSKKVLKEIKLKIQST